jgi:hypothetical protein
LAAAPIIVLLPSTAYGIVAILTRLELMSSLAGSPPVLGLWALFVAPLAALLVLHFDFLAGGAATKRRWLAPAALAVLAVGIIGWANLTSGFSEDQPRPTHIAYELNADTGTARWLSLDPELDAWTQQFFPADPQQEPYEFSAGVERDAFAAAAPVANIEAPVATVVSDARDGTSRTIELLLMSPRDAAELEVHIQGAGAVTRATLEGLTMNLDDYPLAADGELMFSYVAIPDEGVTLILEIAATEPVSVQLEDVTFGLPQFEGLTVTPRPADTMPAPALPLDGTTVIRTYTI